VKASVDDRSNPVPSRPIQLEEQNIVSPSDNLCKTEVPISVARDNGVANRYRTISMRGERGQATVALKVIEVNVDAGWHYIATGFLMGGPKI
jgi:hypothetical protein